MPDGKTELLGLFGGELGQSPSPATHSAWAQHANLNWVYLPLPCPSEDSFLSLATELMQSVFFRGANITNPFKVSALKLPNVAWDASVERCGAANTLYRSMTPQGECQWRLSNTDIVGCLSSLERIFQSDRMTGISKDHLKVVLLGGGAMMKTYSAALNLFFQKSNHKPDLTVWTRLDLEKPFPREFPQGREQATGSSLMLINTLPCGTSAEADENALRALHALDASVMTNQKFYLDAGYLESNTRKTAFQLNWYTVGGAGLFEAQARASFKLWTGFDAPNLPTALRQTAE
ncbi:MAG: hypothetical protein RIR26_1760 [Pseudomonadota bacterium]